MIKFKPDSEESRAWVRFMFAAIQGRDEEHPHPSEVADEALEQFRLRVEQHRDSAVFGQTVLDDLDDSPDCTATVHQPYCRHFKLTKEQRTILTSASKVHRFRRKTLLKVVDQLVRLGFLSSVEDGWFKITSTGWKALK